MTTLAVLITYHDEGELLTACVASLVGQEGEPEEIVVYDDASIVPAERYVVGFDRVRVVRGEINRGPARARNELLRLSTAEYVHFHDADDRFHPEWSARVREAIERTRADMVFTEIASYRDGALICERLLDLTRLVQSSDLVDFCLGGFVLTAAGTHRRESLLAVGGFRSELWQAEDFDLHVRLASSGASHTVIHEALILRCSRPDSWSTDQLQVWRDYSRSLHLLADELPARYHQQLSECAARAGSRLYLEGDGPGARAAFRLGARLGPPRYIYQGRRYQIMARFLGPQVTEFTASLYRRLPAPLRESVARGRLRAWPRRQGSSVDH